MADASSGAGSKSAFTPEELARLPEFHHPRLAPDGEQIAFYYDGTGRVELYVQNLQTGVRRQLTDGEPPKDPRWHILWDGGGECVYFHRDTDGDEQNDIYAATVDGDVSQVVDVDGQAILWDTTDDGRYVLYSSDENDQLNLYRYDTGTDEREQLTTYDQPVWGGQYSPGGDRITYLTNESDDLENRDTYVMHADGSDSRNLEIGDEGADCGPNAWHPDGDRLLVSDNSADLGRAGIYEFETGTVEWLGPDEYEERGVAFTPDGSRVVAIRSRDGAAMPVVYDRSTGGWDDGTPFSLDEGVATIAGADEFVTDDELLVGHTTPTTRATLSRYDLASGDAEVVFEPEYGDIDPDVFVDAEYVTYPSDDWLDIGALFYDPRNGPSVADDATDVPAVVVVHGGPEAQSTKSFDLYVQVLVSEGYAVLQPNYRGSTGRGRAFKNRIHGDWGGMEQADIAAGAHWLATHEWIDADRLAVFGGSYGGYSAYMQLVKHPALWAAGIAFNGITDLHALYEESMPHYQTRLEMELGDREKNAELWTERSPVTHVERLRAPIFVIHGVNDPRVPISQARLFHDALDARGWETGSDFEYTELSEEGHGSRDIDQKVRAFDQIVEFLERRLYTDRE